MTLDYYMGATAKICIIKNLHQVFLSRDDFNVQFNNGSSCHDTFFPAGELCVIILRKGKGKSPNNAHTHSHHGAIS
jgi:hypothetical protein